jgi:hypothetical protein
VRAGRPELPLTVAATCDRLGEIAGGGAESVAREARDAYRVARSDHGSDAAELVAAPLRTVVLGLPAYAGVASAG